MVATDAGTSPFILSNISLMRKMFEFEAQIYQVPK